MPSDFDPLRSPWFIGRRPVRDGELRVSDAERRAVAEALSAHYAEGRLDENELNERLDAAMGAKTRDDLAPLLTDLPRLGVPEPARAPRAPRAPRRFAYLFVVLVAVIFAVSAATAFVRPHVPWLLIGIVAFVVLRHTRYRHHVHFDRDQGRRLFGSW
jgi:hypothetical protein